MTIPSLKGKRTGMLELDDYARVDSMQRGIRRSAPNPYATPEGGQALIDQYHKRHHLDASSGSYGENRAFLWRGTYLDQMEEPVHIGIDVCVPVGTVVDTDFDATVAWIGTDHPEPHGWGNRVILKRNGKRSDVQIWMIYAHLAGPPMCELGQHLKPGDVFARVGDPRENGGWFAHLHVQVLVHEAWKMFKKNPCLIDGYCPSKEWRRWQMLCPNPLQFVKVP